MAAGLYTQAGCVVCTASERDGVRVWWVQQVAMRSDLFGREKGPSASSRKNQIGFTCGGGECTLYIASMWLRFDVSPFWDFPILETSFFQC